VSENIRFGISKSLAATAEQRQWIDTLRDRFATRALVACACVLISGGQARRVALARMLARSRTLLLDERLLGWTASLCAN